MFKTQWNTQYYDPQTPAEFVSTGLHFKRGELYAHVYCCVLAGVENAQEIARIVERVDQRVYDALCALEHFGYVRHTVNTAGKGHAKIWRALR